MHIGLVQRQLNVMARSGIEERRALRDEVGSMGERMTQISRLAERRDARMDERMTKMEETLARIATKVGA